ncbi:MAG TPA: hypothetical protein VHF69_09945, partial [Candidatus Synoicihabitans sp.]|nr:hypothetical protein [Candidatus Synoicihabitans sp.]
MASLEWARHPLGEPHRWPASLRTAVKLLLSTPQPMILWWGDALYHFYNDASLSAVAGRHPAALAQPLAATWPHLAAEFRTRLDRLVDADESTTPALSASEAFAQWVEASSLPYRAHRYALLPADNGQFGGLVGSLAVAATAQPAETPSERENRHAALLSQLSQRLALETDWNEIIQVVCRQLRSHLQVARCLMLEPSGSEEVVVRESGDGTASTNSIETINPSDSWPARWRGAIEGRVHAVSDLRAEGAPEPDRSRSERLGVR